MNTDGHGSRGRRRSAGGLLGRLLARMTGSEAVSDTRATHHLTDSRTVNRGIRSAIRPILAEAGFSLCTARNYWRHTVRRIEVINFQSFNRYHADQLRCTTYSFQVNLGCYLTYVPSDLGPVATKNGMQVPPDYWCHLRRDLTKGLAQPEFPSAYIWYVNSSGSNLGEVIQDAKAVIIRDAFPWFDRLRDDREVLRTLVEDKNNIGEPGATWGFGNNPSPSRHYLTGFVALQLGEDAMALEHLRAALDSKCFTLHGMEDELCERIRLLTER